MNDVINRLINIDNAAKQIVKKEEIRQVNIDDLVLDELNQKKLEIDSDYEVRLKIKKERLDKSLDENKKKIESKIQSDISKMEAQYNRNKKEIVNNITSKILNV